MNTSVILFAVLCSILSAQLVSADEFLNWGNVNLGCTVRCGAYWTCFYKDVRNGGDGTSCNQPSDCNCNSFADDDDEGFRRTFYPTRRPIYPRDWKRNPAAKGSGRPANFFDSKYDDDQFLNWGNVNLGCTVRCGAYWTCFYKDVRNGGDGTSCNQPSGCNCNSFADDDDELFGKFGKKLSKGFKKGKKLYKKGRKIYGKYQKYRGLLGVDDDDQFLNWGNVNLGCTVRCGAYWTCFYKNVRTGGDGTACNQPSGCNCNSFADDDDELFGKFGRKVSKGFKKGRKLYKKGRKIYGKYQKYRGLLGVDDDDELFGKFGRKVSKGFKKGRKLYKKGRKIYGKYQKYRGLLGVDDDDQFLNWGNVNLGCTVRCGAYWTCFYKNVRNGGDGTSCNQPSGCNCNSFADDDDERFSFKKFGKKIKKGVKLYKKGRDIYSQFRDILHPRGNSDDDMKLRIGKALKKGAKAYKKGVRAYNKARKLYKTYKSLTGSDDDMDQLRLKKLIKKGKKLFKKGRKAYKTYERLRDILKSAKSSSDDDELALPAIYRLPNIFIQPWTPKTELGGDDDLRINKKALIKKGLNIYKKYKLASNDESVEAMG